MKILVNKAALGRTPFPPGTYTVQVAKCTPKTSEKGSSMLQVQLTSQTAGPDPALNMIGKNLFENLVFSPEALWKVNDWVQKATGADIPEGEWSIDELIAHVSSVLQGKVFNVEVINETYQGQTRSRINAIL